MIKPKIKQETSRVIVETIKVLKVKCYVVDREKNKAIVEV
jgi:hypothetical protein